MGVTMFHFILVIMALATLMSGCAPIKMAIGVSEPNLTEIKPFDRRSDAEKMLGERLWHVGVADGLTYNIYQFESDQPPRPMLAVGAIVMDIITVGLFELSVQPRNLTEAKQVAVAYDRKERVVFVSKPWPIMSVGPCRRQRSLIPADSGVPVTARPEPVVGLARSTPSTAKLGLMKHLFGWYPVSVDGREFKGNVIELPSGNHEISSRYWGSFATVELLPGRVYQLKTENYYGYKKSKWFFFIEDVISSEVLQCIPPVLH